MFSTEGLPAQVRGISVRLLAACSANGDAFMQYLRSSSDEQLSSFAHGLCPQIQLSWRLPRLMQVLSTGQNAAQLLSHMRKIDIRAAIKSNPLYKFTARASRRKLYPLHTLEASFTFNDPAYLDNAKR